MLAAIRTACLLGLLAFAPLAAHAQEAGGDPSSTALAADPFRPALAGLGAGRSGIADSLAALAALDDPRSLAVVEALVDRRLKTDGAGGLYYTAAGSDALLDAYTGEPATAGAAALATVSINNRVRRGASSLLSQLRLVSPDPAVRLAAAADLRSRPSDEMGEPIRKALATEPDAAVRAALEAVLAQVDLRSEDAKLRAAAAERIGALGDRGLRAELAALVAENPDGSYAEPDAAVRAAAEASIAKIDRKAFFVDAAANFFYGLSLASVLLLAALGLAITFGLMGVINMAHGEMLMLGAYTTYVVLGLFSEYAPAWLDLYLVAAIPAAFAVCALVGMALERSILRFLYGRPLETLLATWGISLILIQIVRMTFGAQNVEVANPSWLSGGYEILRGVVLPWSRIAIVVFAAGMVAAVYALLQRTRLGLYVRAVTQNRGMAAGLGIATSRVDMVTFGLGSGIAGLGGVALSQIGNVGPELGQAYIVDSFMVVVLGGVGKLIGTVVAAVGLGLVNKFLEPVSGAVLGKIFVLGFLILFIQRRPQGIFALRGRAAEA
jgi:urea transport system permease protein